MSVRKGDRGEGKLQVLNKARELKKYSLAALKNEKHFPKSTRWLYASPIATEVREACICIRHANSVYVTNAEEYSYKSYWKMDFYRQKRRYTANANRLLRLANGKEKT